MAVGLAALALFVVRGVWPLAAVAAAGALAQALFAVPPMIVVAVVYNSLVLLFARVWWRTAALESPGLEVSKPRHERVG